MKSELMAGTVVCKTLTTETAHRLMDYVGKCASIHGHSYKWEVTAALDSRDTHANGISIDFGDLKAAMRAVIYDPFDHALVLSIDAPLGPALQPPYLMASAADGTRQKIVAFPWNPTAEKFASYTAMHLQSIGDQDGFDILRVRVWETANSYGQWTADTYED